MLVKLQQQTFQPTSEPSPVATPMEIVDDEHPGHGFNATGAKASCGSFSKGVVDCQTCINVAMASELQRWPPKEQYLAATLTRIVLDGGNTGVPITALMVS